MKIGIIGTGLVGSTTAYTLILKGMVRELVMIDVNKNRAEAEMLDIFHTTAYTNSCRFINGDYADLEGSDIIIITAGAHQQPGETRLSLYERNIEIFRKIVSGIIEYTADSLILIASNPVDLMTNYFVNESGLPHSRIIGSGTVLDTARFRTILGNYLQLSPKSVQACVLGEHGDSEVLIWSNAEIGHIPLETYTSEVGISLNAEIKNHIDSEVRNSAYKIIAGKGATYYGIASSLTQICQALSTDENTILTISSHHEDIEGVKNICLSLPAIINRNGIRKILYPQLSATERQLLRQSAEKIRDYVHN